MTTQTTKSSLSPGVICIAFDAMRVALGMKPQEHTVVEVVTWIKSMGRKLDAKP